MDEGEGEGEGEGGVIDPCPAWLSECPDATDEVARAPKFPRRARCTDDSAAWTPSPASDSRWGGGGAAATVPAGWTGCAGTMGGVDDAGWAAAATATGWGAPRVTATDSTGLVFASPLRCWKEGVDTEVMEEDAASSAAGAGSGAGAGLGGWPGPAGFRTPVRWAPVATPQTTPQTTPRATPQSADRCWHQAEAHGF